MKLARFFRGRARFAGLAGGAFATLVVVWLVTNLMTAEKPTPRRIEHLYGVEDPRFMHVMGVLLGPPIVAGNSYHVLLNGDQIFPSMLAAIRGAKRTINFETYIYWSGEIGKAFADALAERARAGIQVHVMLDWVGTEKIDAKVLDELRRSGVEIQRYHKPSWTGLGKLNNRTHRKLLIVDGQVGYTGGVGIAELWTGHGQDPDHWRDTHLQVEGPVVGQMQSVFMDNWTKTTGVVLQDAGYFPDIQAAGSGSAQVFESSANGGSASMELMYLLALTSSTRTIDLSSAYFVPDEAAIRVFVDAMQRGVKVRIITPGKYIDSEAVRKASRAKWGPLLVAGAEIYEYQPTMFHVKVMIIDDFMVSAGSTNFDDRSFRLNDEANLNVYDRAFAKQQVGVFEDDLKRSKRITLEAWEDRSWKERLEERIASLLDSQL